MFQHCVIAKHFQFCLHQMQQSAGVHPAILQCTKSQETHPHAKVISMKGHTRINIGLSEDEVLNCCGHPEVLKCITSFAEEPAIPFYHLVLSCPLSQDTQSTTHSREATAISSIWMRPRKGKNLVGRTSGIKWLMYRAEHRGIRFAGKHGEL